MSNREWTRADYIEEDVRRHSEEIRALTKITQENATLLQSAIIENDRSRETFYRFVEQVEKEFERRQTLVDNHENRLRDLENWKSRTGAYWAIVAAVVATASSLLIPFLKSILL